MKYPQLVSTRAVNAISDWLVSRLEQLGVEAPQIYTRLLLSLLQSSVQINDPIEFSNLETFFANRKGNNRRYLPSDTDTLKKLNAVQCLREIVSSEQEIATIENLVDELCEKLKDIEKQSADIDDEDQLLVATLSVGTASSGPNNHTTTSHHSQLQQHHHNNNNHHQYSSKHHNKEEPEHREGTAAAAADIETDPKKRYFRAFPALSKEMEDSFRVWRRNAKSLTWPVDRNNISVSSSSSSSTLSTSFGSGSGVAQTSEECVEQTKVEGIANLYDSRAEGNQKGSAVLGNSSTAVSSSAGIKRKSKRRRNQALSKGKTIQNIRKNSAGNSVGGSFGASFGGRHHRNSSPTFWDTDFEGCWEMGRDLIKEFIVKQNKNSRNRSTSESAAYNMRAKKTPATVVEGDSREPLAPEQLQMDDHHNDSQLPTAELASNKTSSPLMPPVVDISFCCDDEYDDTLASVSELTTDTSLNAAAPRRLYQRDTSFGSRELLPEEESTSFDDQLDFAQFKAKFNSSVEALWKDAEQPAAAIATQSENDVFSLTTTSSVQMHSLPAVAPFKENLKNFWSNYYNHHFDLAKIPQQLQQDSGTAFGNMDDSSASLSCNISGSTLNTDIANTSDYYSMPSNLDDFDKSVGSVRRDMKAGAIAGGDRNTPIGVFLQNSIWSENTNGGVGDSDESFYFKVWNSTNKLNQLDAVHGSKITTSGSQKISETTLPFPPYNISKWSEGINAGPTLQQQQQLKPQQIASATSSAKSNNNNCNLHNISIDCTDSSTTASVSTTSCSSAYTHSSAAYSWLTPVIGQGLQADLQSWSTSNPMSLTEMYGEGSGGGSSVTDSVAKRHPTSSFASNEVVGPNINLSNHSRTSSAFIEYSRIRSLVKIVKQEDAMSRNYPPQQLLRPKERFPDDENLLTSERTHFHPIKTYADGHTFDICNSVDAIDYERTDSGSLYLESEKYLEYTRNDNFMEEDSTATSAGASSQPLYATSNCEAANARAGVVGGKKKGRRNFVIKFQMRGCDMACQTEDEAELLAAAAAANKPELHALSLIFSGAGNGMKLDPTALACNDAIEALNKAVTAAAVAAAAACLPPNCHWLPTAAVAGSGGTYRHSSMWTAAQALQQDEVGCDEVDFCSNVVHGCIDDESSSCSALEQQWSMHEIGKKCQLKGHNNNNNNDAGGVDGGAHTLWGMCAACNSEFKSVPANRMLRDELQLEADEIMSDLKYMQDLYIGRSGADGDGADSDSDWEADDDGDEELEECELLPTHLDMSFRTAIGPRRQLQVDVENTGTLMEDEEGNVLQKVNRFIADLLRPENAEFDSDAAASAVDQKQFSGSLWCDNNNEHNIWQNSEVGASNANALKSMELLKHFNVEPHTTNALQVEEDKFLAQLSWEHDNLAEIWQKNTPPQNVLPTAAMKCNATGDGDAAEKNPSTQLETKEEPLFEMQIADKNFKNLQAPLSTAAAAVTSFGIQPEMNASGSAYKRVQQFFSSNTPTNAATTKLKLANRKRRHSASQNLFHHLPPNHSIATSAAPAHNNNNNNIPIADLNRFKLKLLASQPSVFDTDIDMQRFINYSLQHALSKKSNSDVDAEAGGAGGVDSDDLSQPEQTIITCKYWTTIDPMPDESVDMEDIEDTATFSCLIDKSASILKHVTMVSRPLTR